MTRQEIKTDLEQGTYFYNDNETWVLDFWEEAVRVAPDLVEKDFKGMNDFVKNDEEFGDEDGFELNKKYKEIFKNLNLK
ncbi:hypothetical protein ACKGJY_15455 [Hyunsoonleella sp. 2307UL5-6]|uniref:hypothetical protein n=1 Tax=Hyunsoonleella sp. 2307UL5-6 TaxID=3384768 RepID=UPI0039BD2EE8